MISFDCLYKFFLKEISAACLMESQIIHGVLWSVNTFLPLLRGPLGPRVIELVRVLSMGQIVLFENSYLIRLCKRIKKKKRYYTCTHQQRNKKLVYACACTHK